MNGIVQKHRDDGSIKVAKRFGFNTLSPNVSNVIDGSTAGAGGVPGVTLTAELGDELVAIGRSVPHVYAPSGPRFEKFEKLVMTETARRSVVHAGTQSISIPDAARVGTVFCYTWKAGGKCYAEFIDRATDTPIRTPFEVASAGRVKVVADGVRFWLFRDNTGTAVQVVAYGTDGVAQGVSTVAPIVASNWPWDVMAMPGTGNGAVMVQRTAPSTEYIRLDYVTWSAGIVVTGPVFNDHVPTSYGLGWMRNDFDPTHLYLAVSTQFIYTGPVPDPPRAIGVYVARLNLNGTLDALYAIKNDLTGPQAIQIGALSGYVVSAARDVRVSWTSFSTAFGSYGRRMNNTVTTVYAPSGGPGGTAQVKRSAMLAGRVFKLGTRYVAPLYYPSVSGEAAAVTEPVPVAQTAYFLLDLESHQVVGRMEYGTASFDWPFVGWDGTQFGPGFFWLPSPVDDAEGRVHLPFGFAADVITQQFKDGGGFDFNVGIAQVGLLDIRLGGRGVAIEYADELLLPGQMGVAFDGTTFASAGIELGAEVPALSAVNDANGKFELGETHRYVIVYSVIGENGDRIRSIASSVSSLVQMSGANNAASLVIPQLRLTTHDKVLIEIYRDIWDATNNLAGTSHRKITVDETRPGDTRVPIYNDPTVDTITFVDTISNSVAAVGAPLYTDDGTLDYFPCPNFSTGCVFGDRVFVGGYDDRVYYSFQRVPGQALAFNQDVLFFTLPTSQEITALVPLDNRLFIFCERSIWYVDGGNFLNPDGSGSNPTPVELKFKNGCTGRAVAVTGGIAYWSSSGAPWLLTRGLENVFFGTNVEDDAAGAACLDIAVDEDQRIAFVTGTQALVYDQVIGVWSTWSLPTTATAACSWRGDIVYADDAVSPRVLVQTAGSYADAGAPIVTRVEVDDIALADIHGFQVVWECSLLGEWVGAHTQNVEVAYDGADVIDEAFAEPFAAAIDPYRFDWQPRTTECSSIRMNLFDSFPGGVPSGGFTLESIGLYVGIERGMKYNQQGRRMAPAT